MFTNIYESKLYEDDNDDFENEEEKQDYYTGDFWIDCDYIMKSGEVIKCVEIDGEIITDEDDDNELTDDDKKLIGAFYNDELLKEYSRTNKFVELSTWPQDIEKSDAEMNAAKVAIKYRGGSGYHYGWWILKK